MSSLASSACAWKYPKVYCWHEKKAKRTVSLESGGSAVRKRPTGLSLPRVEKRYQYSSWARRPVTRALTACALLPEVRTSSRATTRRKPRSRATSSSTVPRPSASATRVQSVMAFGPGSPDSTPSRKRPPRRLGRRGGPSPFASACGPPRAVATATPPALSRKRRRECASPAGTYGPPYRPRSLA